ncbi:hypothetical protein J8N05_32090 [Streptomyces sp. BH-SS-21]|uniref:Uncharacterized protein n=1 Tax=Streptomyces liliiviolaceus TaxID=2823109 RepID=A0A940XZU1_9ACTN|nr:hypothetical protein [Streptomyces liliiviolaceus]MBQ0852815.1 hypothetical protein [Streptomyces liliiviolaceus]
MTATATAGPAAVTATATADQAAIAVAAPAVRRAACARRTAGAWHR